MLIWLWPWRTRSDTPLNMNIIKGSFNKLGIYIGRDDKTKTEKINSKA